MVGKGGLSSCKHPDHYLCTLHVLCPLDIKHKIIYGTLKKLYGDIITSLDFLPTLSPATELL